MKTRSMGESMDLRGAALAFFAVLLTLGFVWYTNTAAVPRQATKEDVRAEAKSGGYRLISTEELRKLSEEKSRTFLLVDTRQEWEFRTGHIPGSINFPLAPTWWSRLRAKGPLEAALGPDRERLIVFY